MGYYDALIVGGPHDGQTKSVEIGAKFVDLPIVETSKLSSYADFAADVPAVQATMRIAHYRRTLIRGEHAEWPIYVDMRMTTDQAFEALLVRYSQAHVNAGNQP